MLSSQRPEHSAQLAIGQIVTIRRRAINKFEIKKKTDLLINDLPDEANWDDLMYRIYVRQKIEKGLKDSEEGKVYSTDQIKEKLNLAQ